MACEQAWELRQGRWQEVMGDVTCDALITDAPYSTRTHAGHDNGTASANRVSAEDERRLRVDRRNGAVYAVGVNRRKPLSYGAWEPKDVAEFVGAWLPRVRGWFVSLTDHVLAPVWEAELERAGHCTFSPLAYVEPGSRVRISGDGPAQWSVQIVVARPRTQEFARWGALPGAYVLPAGEDRGKIGVIGSKPLWLMRALVRDYSRPGDVVCDPCAGGGTTLLASALEGRRGVGSELDAVTYRLARARLERGYTPSLFAETAGAVTVATQGRLFAGEGDEP